jgi:hypothetical protein
MRELGAGVVLAAALAVGGLAGAQGVDAIADRPAAPLLPSSVQVAVSVPARHLTVNGRYNAGDHAVLLDRASAAGHKLFP